MYGTLPLQEPGVPAESAKIKSVSVMRVNAASNKMKQLNLKSATTKKYCSHLWYTVDVSSPLGDAVS